MFLRVSFVLLALTFTTSFALAECVHEGTMTGQQIQEESLFQTIYILKGNQYFTIDKAGAIEQEKVYQIQFGHAETEVAGPFDRYNRKYLTYYRYPRIVQYLETKKRILTTSGYELKVIGKSIRGRNLYAITPKQLSKDKKTIVMFGRHHGDEGTANWIIEGFVNLIFGQNKREFHQNYQIILYPMVNPDGAEAQTRYNANNRDLNRMWGRTSAQSFDEVKTIHAHLNTYLSRLTNVVVALDMHGSFTSDFLFRVSKKFAGGQFFNHQQKFIDQLAGYDTWQGGDFQTSDGHPMMARIKLIRDSGINALTHESIRNIPKNQGRTVEDLKQQGRDLYTTISDLY